MCGIAGVMGSRAPSLLGEMTGALRHRGPDSDGFFRSADIELGARRLSIIDLVSGDQPIYNETGDKCIVFNGEIYNYRELRRDLIERGHVFRTAGDTEVILHLYEEYGERCVEHLRGMFAFAVSDGNQLFIARDKLGIKPLYYAHIAERGIFLFASEIKALLRCRELSIAPDTEALVERMIVGYALGERSYFDSIKCLRAGHYMRVSRPAPGSLNIETTGYYAPPVEPDPTLDYDAAETALIERLDESVKSHLVADVEVGLALSGGVDSTLLAMAMKEHYPGRLKTFTVADAAAHPDLKLSRMLAAHIASEHTEVALNFAAYVETIPSYMLAEEQPNSLMGLPFHFLCKAIGRRVKVCLNGEGADELFGGYPQYLSPVKKLSVGRAGLLRAKESGLCVGDSVIAFVEDLSSASDSDEYLEKLFRSNLQDQLTRNHLEPVDKYSMASGLEIRVPYLDDDFVGFAGRLPLAFKVETPLGIGKYILKKALLRSYGNVMADIALRIKIGLPSTGFYHLSRFNKVCQANLPDDYVEKHEWSPLVASGDERGWLSRKCEMLLFDLFRFIFIEQRGVLPAEFEVMDFIKEKSSRVKLEAVS